MSLKSTKLERELTGQLEALTTLVAQFCGAMDNLLERDQRIPTSLGRKIAEAVNTLEMQNDMARYFGLNIDWRDESEKVVHVYKAVDHHTLRKEMMDRFQNLMEENPK